MNVLVIPSWYPNGTDKLMGIYHKEFCAALAKREKIKVNMLYIDRQRLNAPLKYLGMKKKEIVEEKGYQVYIRKMLDIHKINPDWELKKYTKIMEKAFKEYLKTNEMPDVLHAEVSIPAGYAASIIGKKYHIPVVVTEHASYFERFFTGNNKKYTDFIIKNAYYTTVSNYMAKIASKFTKTCGVIPNLVDTESFKRKRKKIEGLKLITVAGLRQGKRIDDIIAALKIIIEKESSASLTVIGDGFLESEYKRKCHELGMDEYVHFVGRKTKEEIAEALTNHNIYVISSEKETFCIPGIEALASGIPVVSTKCLGPEEYIDESCGKLVSVGSPEEMAKAILEVYKHLDDYDINHLREVAERYSAKSVTDIAIKIYQDLQK